MNRTEYEGWQRISEHDVVRQSCIERETNGNSRAGQQADLLKLQRERALKKTVPQTIKARGRLQNPRPQDRQLQEHQQQGVLCTLQDRGTQHQCVQKGGSSQCKPGECESAEPVSEQGNREQVTHCGKKHKAGEKQHSD